MAAPPMLVIRDARPAALVPGTSLDVVVDADGHISALAPHGTLDLDGATVVDGGGGIVAPAFVEAHWHPDKFESLHLPDDLRASGPDRAEAIRATYTPDDVARRAERGLRLALAYGVTTARVTVDVDPGVGLVGLEGTLAARQTIGDLMDVEVVAHPSATGHRDRATAELLGEALRLGADVLGGYPNGAPSYDEAIADLDAAFALAERHDVPLDVHVDEWPRADEVMLEPLARRVLERGWGDRVLADHCVGLEAYADEDAARVVDLVARSGMSVCVMPNNLLGDPPYRGLSRLAELLAAGINVCAGTDNVNDGYFPFGNLDPIERAFLTFLGSGMERDADIETVWEMVGTRAARALGIARPGALEVGALADLVVLHEVPDLVQALRRLPGRRTTIRRGQVVAGIDAGWWG